MVLVKCYHSNRSNFVFMHRRFSSHPALMSHRVAYPGPSPLHHNNNNVNDLADVIRYSNTFLCADDTKFVKTIKDVESAAVVAQEDISALESWRTNWTPNLHPDKCIASRYIWAWFTRLSNLLCERIVCQHGDLTQRPGSHSAE